MDPYATDGPADGDEGPDQHRDVGPIAPELRRDYVGERDRHIMRAVGEGADGHHFLTHDLRSDGVLIYNGVSEVES